MLQVLLSAAPGFPSSYSSIHSRSCPRISNYIVVLTTAVLCWLGFLLVPWPGYRVMRSAARLVGLPKFSSVAAYIRLQVRYTTLDTYISQLIQYRVTEMVFRCVLRYAPYYICDICCPVLVLAARRALRSLARGELLVPRVDLATVQRRAFSVVGS